METFAADLALPLPFSSLIWRTSLFQTETLDFVFWLRQFIGLSIGLAAGFLQLEGMFVILGYFVVMFVLSNMYAYKMLNVNDDDFANNELMMEGIGNSAGIFFVSFIWELTTFYSWHGSWDTLICEIIWDTCYECCEHKQIYQSIVPNFLFVLLRGVLKVLRFWRVFIFDLDFIKDRTLRL